jgi:hypothetical protein
LQRRILIGAAAVLVCLALLLTLGMRRETTPEGVYLGVYMPAVPFSMDALNDFENITGAKVGIIMWFTHSTDSFPTDFVKRVRDRGAIPLITWQPFLRGGESGFLLDYIASGGWDNYIRQWANDAKRCGGTILIRWGHEFNGYWYPWSVPANGNDPQKFVRAWRHIVDVFRQTGAKNVQWVWCPYHLSNPDEPWNDPFLAYPGDDYVDWIGLDGYNWGTSQNWSEWLPFRSIYASLIRTYSTAFPNKPIMIAEFASAEEGGDKAAWIRELPEALADMPQIRAVVWFNTQKETDWRVNSSPESLGAFRSIVDNFIRGSGGLADLPRRYKPPAVSWPQAGRVENMPFYVYSNYLASGNHFYPTGWMGDYTDITMDEECSENPHSGPTCIKVIYSAEGQKRWAGVYWQNPPNNWGMADGGFNLSRARRLVFWARGEKGGEIVQFKMGGIAGYYPDSAVATAGLLTLENEWRRYEINLSGKDLSYISGGFCFVVKSEAGYNTEGCIFYLDEIFYE